MRQGSDALRIGNGENSCTYRFNKKTQNYEVVINGEVHQFMMFSDCLAFIFEHVNIETNKGE